MLLISILIYSIMLQSIPLCSSLFYCTCIQFNSKYFFNCNIYHPVSLFRTFWWIFVYNLLVTPMCNWFAAVKFGVLYAYSNYCIKKLTTNRMTLYVIQYTITNVITAHTLKTQMWPLRYKPWIQCDFQFQFQLFFSIPIVLLQRKSNYNYAA